MHMTRKITRPHNWKNNWTKFQPTITKTKTPKCEFKFKYWSGNEPHIRNTIIFKPHAQKQKSQSREIK